MFGVFVLWPNRKRLVAMNSALLIRLIFFVGCLNDDLSAFHRVCLALKPAIVLTIFLECNCLPEKTAVKSQARPLRIS